MEGYKNIDRLQPSVKTEGVDLKNLREKCYEAMNDDLNTPIVISYLFDACHNINAALDKKISLNAEDIAELKKVFYLFAFDIMGLKQEIGDNSGREDAFGKVVDMLLEQRMKAKANKDWETSDMIRNSLTALGFEVKDTKDGFTWKLNR